MWLQWTIYLISKQWDQKRWIWIHFHKMCLKPDVHVRQTSQNSWYKHIKYSKRNKSYTQHLKPSEWHHTANIKSNAGGEPGQARFSTSHALILLLDCINYDSCFPPGEGIFIIFDPLIGFIIHSFLLKNRKDMESKMRSGLAYQTKGWYAKENVQLVSTPLKPKNTLLIATGSRASASWKSSILSTRGAHFDEQLF